MQIQSRAIQVISVRKTRRRFLTNKHNNYKTNVVIVNKIIRKDSIHGKIATRATQGNDAAITLAHWLPCRMTHGSNKHISTITRNNQTDVNTGLANGSSEKANDLLFLLQHIIVIVRTLISISIIIVVVAIVNRNKETIWITRLHQLVKVVLVKTIVKIIKRIIVMRANDRRRQSASNTQNI